MEGSIADPTGKLRDVMTSRDKLHLGKQKTSLKVEKFSRNK